MSGRSLAKRLFAGGALCLSLAIGGRFWAAPPPLTFEERVKAQEAIERVYYDRRIWPTENQGLKPPFEQAVPHSLLVAEVTDYLKKSAALEYFWRRPIEPSQLQAEMDRMARGTKDPAGLASLFAALGNDPYLIAECLARPALADRMIRDWYASEPRFHEQVRQLALIAERAASSTGLDSSASKSPIMKMRFTLSGGDATYKDDMSSNGWRVQPLHSEEFEKIFSQYPDSGKIQLREEPEAFILSRTVRKESGLLEIELQAFPKRTFDSWWQERSPALAVDSLRYSEPSYSFAIPDAVPAPDTVCQAQWLDTNLENVVDPRFGATAIWTGTEMIVWGGGAGRGLPSGGRYNPATDTWVPTSMDANCPSGRQYHTAVWTGSVMIIWGGNDGGSSTPYLNTGSMYDPASDTWTATSVTGNVPKARQNHTAVWTGSEMIVWGGFGCTSATGCTTTGVLNNGARFDPAANNWTTATSATGAPVARQYQTAVWDDAHSAMIIWGGYGSALLNTGGRYYPATDTWSATSSTSVPTARQYHSAVWTGTYMVVWGGQGTAGALNTGGRYNPLEPTRGWPLQRQARPLSESCTRRRGTALADR